MSVSTPEVCWEAKITNTTPHQTNYNYVCKVSAINPNDPGYAQLVIGYYIVDFIGHVFEIKELNIDGDAKTVRCYDLIEDDYSYGPYNDRIAYVFNPAGNTALLTQAKLDRLDKSAEDFIQKVNKAINKNLDNSAFGVEELANELGFSSSLVYRKLKQFTGQIPSGYLRNYRLQMAAARIRKDPYISLKTVRYEVGFASASHFTHAFKEKFGETPSEYAKKVI